MCFSNIQDFSNLVNSAALNYTAEIASGAVLSGESYSVANAGLTNNFPLDYDIAMDY